MIRSIWKYKLAITQGAQRISMPAGTIVLTAAMQGSRLCLWADIDSTYRDHEDRWFRVLATGELFEITGTPAPRYIATVQDHGYVWHVYEVG
jgi:hypothetical protein